MSLAKDLRGAWHRLAEAAGRLLDGREWNEFPEVLS